MLTKKNQNRIDSSRALLKFYIIGSYKQVVIVEIETFALRWSNHYISLPYYLIGSYLLHPRSQVRVQISKMPASPLYNSDRIRYRIN